MERKKITPLEIQMMKKEGKKSTLLTAYDYPQPSWKIGPGSTSSWWATPWP